MANFQISLHKYLKNNSTKEPVLWTLTDDKYRHACNRR